MRSPVLRAARTAARLLPQSARTALYRLGPVTSILRKTLNRAAPGEVVAVNIAAGPNAGARMRLDMQLEKDYWLGTYEPQLMRAIGELLSQGQVAYDVGAHIGYESLAMARAVGSAGSVVAFEAMPANISRLQDTVELNEDGARITVVTAAVAEAEGRAQFYLHESSMMGKLTTAAGRHLEYSGTVEVDVIAIDEWAQRTGHPNPDLVKIDVEGGEALVLSGMRHTLREAKPKLLIEIHGAEALEEVQAILGAADYTLHQLKEGFPELEPPAENWANLVAFPSDGR